MHTSLVVTFPMWSTKKRSDRIVDRKSNSMGLLMLCMTLLSTCCPSESCVVAVRLGNSTFDICFI